jgi:2,3-diketo-5-methylthio-1-phosphopentane phosphatase
MQHDDIDPAANARPIGGRSRVMAGEAAPPPPPLRPGDIPIAILVDFDGTVALTDVSDTVMAAYVPGRWEEIVEKYDEGLLGSRDLMTWEVSLIRTEPERLLATAGAQPHDPDFAPFVRRAWAAGIPVEVVSDGFGFFIRPALERLGLPDLPVTTARTTFRGRRARIEFPNGHPECFVCGTCKRNRVLAHQDAGRGVVFIGDGESDRYAAGYSDLVFAKRSLVSICDREGWPYRPWQDFAELDRWLALTVAAAVADPGSVPRPVRRPFFCGPEVWGPGQRNPPIPGDVPGV